MFDISGWEFLTLAALAVVIFGPERLPKIAADAGKFIKQARTYVHTAKADLTQDLPEFNDLKMSDLTPRGLLCKTIGDDDPLADLRKDLDFKSELDFNKEFEELHTPLTREHTVVRLREGELPPFDPDST